MNLNTEHATLLPICYLAPISYYAILAASENIALEKHEHFVKQTYRNRCSICGANGRLDLIIPIQHKGERQVMKDVRIANSEKWQALHWKSLEAAYRSSPYFEYYEDDLQPFYERPFEFLTDLNLELQALILKLLRFSVEFDHTLSYHKVPADSTDLRGACDPKEPSSDLVSLKDYIQVFSDRNGFLSDLSIVDLLFNQGPDALEYLSTHVPVTSNQ